jgi:translation elongation factor P/translation initiation factor 5A
MIRSVVCSLLLLVASTTPVVVAFSPLSRPSIRPASTALGVAIDTSDIKNGMTVELDGEPFKVISFSIMKQARGAAKTTIKFKNLMRGTSIENTYRSGEKFETAQIDKDNHIFSYSDEVSWSVAQSQTHKLSRKWKIAKNICPSDTTQT